jgi:hypothetical protein
MTLEIYVVQYVLIDLIRGWGLFFPLNWIVLTVIIVVSAFILHKVCNLGNYKPDRVRFDYCGDVEINGIQYQVKFENATLTNINTLHNAQKDARVKR